MTDYPRKGNSWKKQEIRAKWQNFLAVFITIVLIFALISGVTKSLNLAKFVGDSKWDGVSSVSFAVNSSPPSILIYQTYPKNLALITLNGDFRFATGIVEDPVRNVDSVFANLSPEQIKIELSKILHAPVTNYLKYGTRPQITESSVAADFKKFASPTTPVKIFLAGIGDSMETDFTRKDMIRLWWQVKSMGVSDLEVIDGGKLGEEIVLSGGQKVLGVDETSFNALLSKYLESRKILESREKVVIVNSSGVAGAGKLVSEFVDSVGVSIDRVEVGSSESGKTTIFAEKSYVSDYLAKLLSCDITTLPNMEKDKITIVVGSDFSQKYNL